MLCLYVILFHIVLHDTIFHTLLCCGTLYVSTDTYIQEVSFCAGAIYCRNARIMDPCYATWLSSPFSALGNSSGPQSQRVQLPYIVECRVSILGIVIVFLGKYPHNST